MSIPNPVSANVIHECEYLRIIANPGCVIWERKKRNICDVEMLVPIGDNVPSPYAFQVGSLKIRARFLRGNISDYVDYLSGSGKEVIEHQRDFEWYWITNKESGLQYV